MLRKKDIIRVMAEKLWITQKDSQEYFETLVDIITENLQKGEDVDFFGLGRFSTKDRKVKYAKEGKIEETEVKSVSFKASKTLKDSLNER